MVKLSSDVADILAKHYSLAKNKLFAKPDQSPEERQSVNITAKTSKFKDPSSTLGTGSMVVLLIVFYYSFLF